MNRRVADRMRQLLETERELLLSGELEGVGALAPEKEALAASLGAMTPDDLSALSKALDRNRLLLGAARDGVSTVLETLKAQKMARSTLSTYDSSGKPATIAQPRRDTERRF